jgi:hypothetical protein
MSLPDVKCQGEPPFVICSEFPGGAIAIGTLPRISAGRKIYYPLADVAIQCGSKNNLIGIFGRFKSLNIISDMPDFKIDKIYGQDLAGDTAINITDMVQIRSGQIVIPGEIIQMTGLAAATKGDLSEPGMVMKIIYHNQ